MFELSKKNNISHGCIKVVMISGGESSGQCGVDDYTEKLVIALKEHGCIVTHYKIKNFIDWFRSIKGSFSSNIIHIQYPTISWRISLMPLIAAILFKLYRKKLILTLHEFKKVHLLRKVISFLLLQLSVRCILTNRFEVTAIYRLNINKSEICVIPIGSNISPNSSRKLKRKGVIYFGLLAPNKGLEEFLRIVKPLHEICYPVTVVGMIVNGHEKWLCKIRNENKSVIFKIGLNDYEVSHILQKSFIALLPYPDGVSERRGTALEALVHGLQLITTSGSCTERIHHEIAHIIKPENNAIQLIFGLINNQINPVPPSVVDKYIFYRTWANIAYLHTLVYKSLVI